jgi:hypothetical protein
VRGPLTDGLVFDAVRVRLIEIGDAVKDVSSALLTDNRASLAGRWPRWANSSHRCFTTSHAIVEQTLTSELAQLATAVRAARSPSSHRREVNRRSALRRAAGRLAPRGRRSRSAEYYPRSRSTMCNR